MSNLGSFPFSSDRIVAVVSFLFVRPFLTVVVMARMKRTSGYKSPDNELHRPSLSSGNATIPESDGDPVVDETVDEEHLVDDAVVGAAER